MSNDLNYAAQRFIIDIDLLISALHGIELHKDLNDRDALDMAIIDLMNAKGALLLALCGDEVAN